MAEEKKNDGADDPISLLLEQALTRQRDEMMENFSHILQRLPIASGASSSSDHFGGVIARFVGKVKELESRLKTGVTGASPPTVTSMGGSFYLGGLVQGRRP
jgi:hypothetical protein